MSEPKKAVDEALQVIESEYKRRMSDAREENSRAKAGLQAAFMKKLTPLVVERDGVVSAARSKFRDEMSRLIAQELAARERELVQLKPEDIKKAHQWIGTDTNANQSEVASPSFKKSVSFSNINTTNVIEEEHEAEEFEETAFIFSKLKKIKDETDTTNAVTITITMQQLYDKLIELERRMDANHAEIMRLFNDGRRV